MLIEKKSRNQLLQGAGILDWKVLEEDGSKVPVLIIERDRTAVLGRLHEQQVTIPL